MIRESAEDADFSMHFPEANTLEGFLIELGAILAQRFPEIADRFNWLMLQFATLPDEEKRILQNQVIRFQQRLREQISQYESDEAAAERLAWLVHCSFFGYQQMFAKMEIGQSVDLSVADYSHFLAQPLVDVCEGKEKT